MQPSRHERRMRDRERTRRHAALYATGLDTPDDGATVLLVHHLAAILGRRQDNRRASRAAEAVHKVFDATLAHRPPAQPVDCKLGCAHCCYLFVSAAAPEVLLLAGAVRRRKHEDATAIQARIAEAHRAAGEHRIGDRVHKAVACGLLDDDRCGFYAERPLGCRGHVSRAVDACLANVADAETRIPGSPEYARAARGSKLALFAALKSVGLPHRSYELNAALERALATEDAERRWLKGEDIFAGVPVDPTRTAEVEALLDRLAARASA